MNVTKFQKEKYFGTDVDENSWKMKMVGFSNKNEKFIEKHDDDDHIRLKKIVSIHCSVVSWNSQVA